MGSDLEIKQYVAGFAFHDYPDGTDVLLIEKARPAWQKGFLNGVGGSVEDGETPVEAMRREFREEASLVTLPGEWVHCIHLEAFGGGAEGYSECVVDFFRMELDDVRREKVLQATDEVLWWVPVCDMWSEPVIPNLRWLVPLCRGGVITVREASCRGWNMMSCGGLDMLGTGDSGYVLSSSNTNDTRALAGVSSGPLKPLGVMSDYEVEQALICRIESMDSDEARQWLIRMTQV